MRTKETKGHLMALITILIWGTTFISTKVLLREFSPIEILFIRFVLGFLLLFLACPRFLRVKNIRQEIVFALAGLSGVCLYYLLENIALTYTLAANVGVIIATAPFFTAIFSRVVAKDEKLKANFIAGFVIAMAGICLISFTGLDSVQVSPAGDILALAAAAVWAVYSLLSKKIGQYGYNMIQSTRRVFFYGLLFMIPALFIFGFHVEIKDVAEMKNLLNFVYLGAGASALCFVTWNLAVRVLGAVKTSVYIYMVPVITVAASALILHEKITVLSAVGTALTLAGLLLSEYRGKK